MKKTLTTASGAPVSENQHSITAGARRSSFNARHAFN